MSEVPCFWIEPTDRMQLSLRRYSQEEGCPGPYRHHQGTVDIEQREWPKDQLLQSPGDDPAFPHEDSRWPATCDHCGYTFEPEDGYRIDVARVYVRPETGDEYIMRPTKGSIPPGAMWHLDWLEGNPHYTGPDGLALAVMLPNDAGEWWIDGPSSQGGNWQRTGTPPKITVTPSIHAPGKYHGWLRDGVLAD